MLIEFKTLGGRSFRVDFDENATVGSAKTILRDKYEITGDQINLIYAGKILSDESLIKDIGIKSGKFVVVQTRTAKAPASPQPTPPPQPSSPSTPKPESTQEAPPSPTETAEPAGNRRMPPVPLPDPLTFDSNLTNLTDMGYDEETAVRALVAAYNNLERAADLCAQGNVPQIDLPPPRTQSPGPSQAPAQTPAPSQPSTPSNTPAPAQAPRPTPAPSMRAAPRMSPQIQQISNELSRAPNEQIAMFHQQFRQLFAENANQTLNETLAGISRLNPVLAQKVSQNPAPFFSLLGLQLRTQQGPPGYMQQQQQQQAPSMPDLGLTDEDRQAIQRLIDLTHQEELTVVQIYIACNRDEALAANLLLSDSQ